MQIKIGVPCLDMVHARFVECLTSLQTVGSTHLDFQVGTIVYVGRETICSNAIADGTDYILWVDSDMVFEPDALVRLVDDIEQKGCDIVTGLCFMRRPPYRPCIWSELKMAHLPENRVSAVYENYPKNELFEIDACGMAFCLMKTEVAEAIMKEKGTCFSPIPGYGEDLSFCIRAKQLGYKLWCDSSVKIGHIGQQICAEETFEAYRVIEANNRLQKQADTLNKMASSAE